MRRKPFPARSFIFVPVLLITFAFIVGACGGAAAPATEEPAAAPESTEESIQPVMTQSAPTQSIQVTSIPAMPERRRLTLEFPPKIRTGDSDVVRLTLEMDDLGNIVPTAETEGNVVTGEVVEIPDLYETHNVIAEARLDISGLQVSPPEMISQTLSKGQSVNFYWSVRPEQDGVYRGTVWFYLRFVDKVSGEESQKTVSAQLVEIEAVSFLGLPSRVVRTFGGVGSVIGAIIGFPFIDDIIKFIFGRRKARRK